ncbi:MAG: hypothetical protein ABSA91_11810 [Acidimicrobiales bacterium]
MPPYAATTPPELASQYPGFAELVELATELASELLAPNAPKILAIAMQTPETSGFLRDWRRRARRCCGAYVLLLGTECSDLLRRATCCGNGLSSSVVNGLVPGWAAWFGADCPRRPSDQADLVWIAKTLARSGPGVQFFR